MKKIIAFIALFLAGCAPQTFNMKQYIEMEGHGEIVTITDTGTVKNIREQLHELDWQDGQVSTTHPADYQFHFQFKDKNVQAKAMLYSIWLDTGLIANEIQYATIDESFLDLLIGQMD